MNYNVIKNIFSLCEIINSNLCLESEFEGELEVVGGDNRRTFPVDANIKVTYKRPKDGQYASPMDPHDLELSFTNKINARSGMEWGFADERMTGKELKYC